MQRFSAVFNTRGQGRKGRVGGVDSPLLTIADPPCRYVTVDPADPAPADDSASGGQLGCDRPEYCCAAVGPVETDAGMSTVEYAVGTVVAAAFAAVLYKIVTGDSVVAGLTDLINSALSTTF